VQFVIHDEMYNDDGIHKQSDSSDDHRTGLCSSIQFSLNPNCQAKCGKATDGAAAKRPAKVLGFMTSPMIAKSETISPPRMKRKISSMTVARILDMNSDESTARVRFGVNSRHLTTITARGPDVGSISQ
jgi:hypothetical protein